MSMAKLSQCIPFRGLSRYYEGSLWYMSRAISPNAFPPESALLILSQVWIQDAALDRSTHESFAPVTSHSHPISGKTLGRGLREVHLKAKGP
jgi:hypothetical protein